MNGKRVAFIISLATLVGICFAVYFKLESKFVSAESMTHVVKAIDDNDKGIDELGKKVDRQIIKDYRRQIRELEFEYGTPAQMPDKVRKYYFWLKDELARLIDEQKG